MPNFYVKHSEKLILDPRSTSGSGYSASVTHDFVKVVGALQVGFHRLH